MNYWEVNKKELIDDWNRNNRTYHGNNIKYSDGDRFMRFQRRMEEVLEIIESHKEMINLFVGEDMNYYKYKMMNKDIYFNFSKRDVLDIDRISEDQWKQEVIIYGEKVRDIEQRAKDKVKYMFESEILHEFKMKVKNNILPPYNIQFKNIFNNIYKISNIIKLLNISLNKFNKYTETWLDRIQETLDGMDRDIRSLTDIIAIEDILKLALKVIKKISNYSQVVNNDNGCIVELLKEIKESKKKIIEEWEQRAMRQIRQIRILKNSSIMHFNEETKSIECRYGNEIIQFKEEVRKLITNYK